MDVGLSLRSLKVTVITFSINKGGLPLSVLRILKSYLYNINDIINSLLPPYLIIIHTATLKNIVYYQKKV